MLVAAVLSALLGASSVAASYGKYFDRYVLVILENTDKDDAAADPYFQSIQAKGITLDNYWATIHPSQPNYWALVAQKTFVKELGLNYGNGDNSFNITGHAHIGDALDSRGVTWKIYSENYPGNCFMGVGAGSDVFTINSITAKENNNLYKRKHNPFVSFESVYSNQHRCNRHIGSADDFKADLAAGTLPQYVFYVPNQVNDGHDAFKFKVNPTALQAPFLQSFLANFDSYDDRHSENTLIHITFDENDVYDGAFQNQTACPDPTLNCPNDVNIVYSVLTGSAIKPEQRGKVDSTYYNHFSVVATQVENWGLEWTTPDLEGRNATVFSLPQIRDVRHRR